MSYTTVLYVKEPPGRQELVRLVSILEDPVEDLVRKDSKFKKLCLDADDFVDNAELVVETLLQHKVLMQRPLVVKGDRAIIGRPKSRIVEFLKS